MWNRKSIYTPHYYLSSTGKPPKAAPSNPDRTF